MRRRFPPPLTAAELEESFAIKDANGQILAYVYFEPDPNNDSRRTVMNLPSPDLKQLKEVGLTHFLRPWVRARCGGPCSAFEQSDTSMLARPCANSAEPRERFAMHDSRRGETYRAQKIANELNLVRFRKLVSDAKTPIEGRLARFLLREQEEIALELDSGHLRQRSADRY